MTLLMEDVLKLLLAMMLGGIIGAEREYRDKVAGFRTITVICVGATLFTILSQRLGGAEDGARIAANIVSGVGFLGAGAILTNERRVTGVTTASTIWLAAALGMGLGCGQYLLAVIVTAMMMFVLLVFRRFETGIDGVRIVRTYEVTSPARLELIQEMEDIIAACGLKVVMSRQARTGREMENCWTLRGTVQAHEQFTEKLLVHDGITGFRM